MFSVLKDYNVEHNDIFGATTDAGSDVRATVTKCINDHWGWCPSHMLPQTVSVALTKKGSDASKLI